ncbi:MAG TPA: hypothetical protein VI854_01175 [Acidimicrobiia bacterium]|nr:hypothetical protein [Acidimicrobiia bacterium]
MARLLFHRLPLVLIAVLSAGACSVFEGDNADGGAVPGPPTTISAGDGSVIVKNIAFNPKTITVAVNQEVAWTIDDNGVTHTVTADDRSFDSGRLQTGDFKRVFDQPGEVAYHCEVHARMKGTVVVTP